MEPITGLRRAVQLEHGDSSATACRPEIRIWKIDGMDIFSFFAVYMTDPGPVQAVLPSAYQFPTPPHPPSLKWSSVRLTTHFHVVPGV